MVPLAKGSISNRQPAFQMRALPQHASRHRGTGTACNAIFLQPFRERWASTRTGRLQAVRTMGGFRHFEIQFCATSNTGQA